VVRMKNNVMQFPQRAGQAAVPTDKPLVIFALGGKRVAIRWTVTELRDAPAEVIPIRERRQRKGGDTRRRSE
jgi:hypothetical protein